jgi:hypothetical protein
MRNTCKAGKVYTFDFEATTKEPVYAYMLSIVNMYNIEERYNYTCEDGDVVEIFLNFMRSCKSGTKFYAHNLTYDHAIIRSWCHFREGQEHIPLFDEFILPGNRKVIKSTVTFLDREIHLHDSFVLFASSLAQVMEGYTDLHKGDTPIFHYRQDVEIRPEDILYCENDAVGLAIALRKRLEQGANRMTLASDAKQIWSRMGREFYGTQNFSGQIVPHLEYDVDATLRPAYKGGFCYVNEIFADRTLEGPIQVFDVNSMYPAMMLKQMPVGKPVYVKAGKVVPNVKYPLGIQKFIVREAHLKEGKVPHITNGGNTRFGGLVYIKDIEPEMPENKRTFSLTLEEFELFNESYFYEGLRYLGGYHFKSMDGVFSQYIDRFTEMKNSSDPATKIFGKTMLNSLYGKMGENPNKQTLEIVFEDDVQKYKIAFEEIKTGGYLPMAIYITSYSRIHLIRSIYTIGVDHFIYTDTDSIHCFKTPNTDNLDQHPSRFGAWKLEDDNIKRAKYLRTKRYVQEMEDGQCKPVCAGIRKSDLKRHVKSVDDFYIGRPIPTEKVRYGIGGQYFRPTLVKI